MENWHKWLKCSVRVPSCTVGQSLALVEHASFNTGTFKLGLLYLYTFISINLYSFEYNSVSNLWNHCWLLNRQLSWQKSKTISWTGMKNNFINLKAFLITKLLHVLCLWRFLKLMERPKVFNSKQQIQLLLT